MKHVSYLLICLCLLVLSTTLAAKEKKAANPIRTIVADYHQTKGDLNDFFKQCVGAGRAGEGLRADWQQQLLEIKKECDFKQIRFHALFHDEMGVYREDENGVHYNWQYIDALYDYLVSIDVKPFIELAFMPNQLSSGPETIFWWRGNVTPPKDHNKWEMLVKNFAEHLKERYGEDEVATWYFEVWNEPNLNENGFFTGTQQDYFKLYKHSAQGVKAASPRFRIGGPATAGCAWVPELMEYCKKENVALDFITTHHYGVDGYLDEYGAYQLRMPADADGLPNTIAKTVQTVRNSDYPKAEVHFTEWSSSYSPRDPVHDTYQNATIILNALRKVNPAPESMSYWTFTDIFEEPGTVNTPFHGGFGLMNMQGVKKPTYFAYRFLNELGKKELKTNDTDSWVCTNGQGDVQALFWNLTILPQDGVPNQSFYKRDLPPANTHPTRLSLNNLPKGKYMKEVYRVGYKLNDAYTTYYEMGSPTQLTKLQVETLKKMTSCAPVATEIINIDNGAYEEEFAVRDNDVFFVKLKKID